MTDERSPRADAVRNREAILEAAEVLFAGAGDGRAISTDAIADAAGVGKGTVFRRFGDRRSLLAALHARLLRSLRHEIDSGGPPLGPATPPVERVVGIVGAIARFKLTNAALADAIEGAGSAGPVPASTGYGEIHRLLASLLASLDLPDPSYRAHLLLGGVRADLLRHLTEVEELGEAEIVRLVQAGARSIIGT